MTLRAPTFPAAVTAVALILAQGCRGGETGARSASEGATCGASVRRTECGGVLAALPGWSGRGRPGAADEHAGHDGVGAGAPTFDATLAELESALDAVPIAGRSACLRRVLDEGDGALGIALLEDRLDTEREAVAAFARDASPRVRAAVAMARGGARDCREQRALLEALDDPEALVREAVVVALRNCVRPSEARDAAIDRALTDSAPAVRAEAATTLGVLSSRCAPAVTDCAASISSAGAKLTPLMHDLDEDVRVHAIYAIKNLGYSRANDDLRGLLGGSERTRRAALLALGATARTQR